MSNKGKEALPSATQAVSRLRFAVTSCAKYDQGYVNAYARMAEADVDAVLHLGDYLYEEPSKEQAPGDRFPDPLTETYTVAEYRRRYARYKLDPDLQRGHPPGPTTSPRTRSGSTARRSRSNS